MAENGVPKGSDLVVGGVIEITKLLLMAYFQMSQMQGKTPEQVQTELDAERVKFYQKDPNQIPDPT